MMWSEPALHLLITKLPMKTHNCALSNTCNSKSNYYIWYIWHLFQSLEPFISVISNDYGSIMAASSWKRDAIQPGAFWDAVCKADWITRRRLVVLHCGRQSMEILIFGPIVSLVTYFFYLQSNLQLVLVILRGQPSAHVLCNRGKSYFN